MLLRNTSSTNPVAKIHTHLCMPSTGEPTCSSSPYREPNRWSSSRQKCQEWSGDPGHNVNIYSNLVPSIKDLGHLGSLHHNPAHSPLSRDVNGAG